MSTTINTRLDALRIELLNRINETQPINIKCNTMEQLKVLKHLQASFAPSGIRAMKLIKNGIRVTDSVNAKADFIYNKKSDKIELYEKVKPISAATEIGSEEEYPQYSKDSGSCCP